ncbi:hypothetical protein RI129_006499 [Pyrocoelia pectoralis]|uniref:Major facilitator superfamily (MFS) profile domain-containing protein n=1 Tax=Pyrocoelia pectoralis TaxID=417401 RepID=A0AAN7VK67_9COLE
MFSLEKLKANGRLQQFTTVIFATLSAVSDGMQYAWTAPIIPLLQNTSSQIQITQTDVLWLENIYMIGGFAGIPLIIFTVDRFGRKASILAGVVQSVLSWILIGCASSVEFLYVGRFLSGLAADVGFVTIPIYTAEIADKKIRGFLGSWIYLMMLIGVLVMYSVGPYVTIPISSAVGCSFLLLELCIFPFMPESPYFYILRGNPKAARTSLRKLRPCENVDKELEEITASIETQMSEKGGVTDLLFTKSARKALLITVLLNFAQHFSCYSVILMNLHSILDEADVKFNASTAAIVFSTLMLLSALFSSVIVDRTGRKVLLCSSSILTGLSMLVLAIYFALKNNGVNVESHNWIAIFSVMCYAFSYKYGLGLLAVVVAAEIFPTNVKTIGMTIGDTTYSISSILSIYMYQMLKDMYGIHVPFFIFTVCCFFVAIFSAFCIPETKGKTLHQIQLILNGESVRISTNATVTNTEGTHL